MDTFRTDRTIRLTFEMDDYLFVERVSRCKDDKIVLSSELASSALKPSELAWIWVLIESR
jgi:hypothetical protein